MDRSCPHYLMPGQELPPHTSNPTASPFWAIKVYFWAGFKSPSGSCHSCHLPQSFHVLLYLWAFCINCSLFLECLPTSIMLASSKSPSRFSPRSTASSCFLWPWGFLCIFSLLFFPFLAIILYCKCSFFKDALSEFCKTSTPSIYLNQHLHFCITDSSRDIPSGT